MKLHTIITALCAMACGLASVCIPVIIGGGASGTTGPLSVFFNGIEDCSLLTVVLLIASGSLLALLFHSARPYILGFLAIASFPLILILDLHASPRGHNLWPLEIIVYTFFAIPVLVGAYSMRCIIWFIKKLRHRSVPEA